MDERLSNLAGALIYKGTASASTDLSASATGEVKVVSKAFSVPATMSAKNSVQAVEIGDYLIYNGSKWDAVNGENQVSASIASNAAGAYAIGTVDGVTLYGKDTNTTYSAGSGLTLSSTTFSHDDTSTQEGMTGNTGNTVIQNIGLDDFGHVTSLSTKTISFTNSRDAGYGKITPANSTAVTALTGNTTAVVSSTYSEELKLSAANKWVVLAGSNSSTANSDEMKIAHALSGITAQAYGPTQDVTQSAKATAAIKVPQITVDAAGHVTAITERTITVTDTDTNTNTVTTIKNATATTTASTTNIITSSTSGTGDNTLSMQWIEY